ncbi:hypothetical protein H1235_05475 [Pseudoxanthomonas sp. NC8]|nr:hypothetical protein H1235_05475 [Pseudoxanthomonas sp. NC8]
MRTWTGFLAWSVALTVGGAHASAGSDTLRISLTVVDRCDIRGGRDIPTVNCSAGVPRVLATAGAATATPPAGRSLPSYLPVPADTSVDPAPVTVIVF